MKWSFKIAELFGISIKVHSVFLLLLVFIGWSNASVGGLVAGIAAVLFILIIFFFVLLHELGHSLAAMRYGVRVRDIVLLPIGGVARMENLPKDPKQEIVIALAGPAVNFATVAILFTLMKSAGQPVEWMNFTLTGMNLWNDILAVNLFMGLFNLIPAIPMDGGRVLRGLLAMRFSYGRATHYATNIGKIIAGLFVLVGILWLHNWWLVLIAIFVFAGAGSEEQIAKLREAIDQVPVARVMSTRMHILRPDDPLRRAIEHTYQSGQHDFPVLDGDRLIGMLPSDRVLDEVNYAASETPVRHLMNTRFLAVRPFASLSRVYEEMTTKGIGSVPVVENDRMVGMLTLENIGKYLAVASSTKGEEH